MKPLNVKTISAEEIRYVNKFYKEQGEKSRVQEFETVVVAESSFNTNRNSNINDGDACIVAALRMVPMASKSQALQISQSLEEAPYWWLRSVYVAEAFRREGLATKILRAALVQCEEQCYCFPFVELQSLYETVGFQACSLDNLPAGLRGRFQRYQRKNAILAMAWSPQTSH
ncbi:MAG: GNAT family N-acetyltransferase [Cellvibrionaceae bacterium]